MIHAHIKKKKKKQSSTNWLDSPRQRRWRWRRANVTAARCGDNGGDSGGAATTRATATVWGAGGPVWRTVTGTARREAAATAVRRGGGLV
jgi:hypothetical protein